MDLSKRVETITGIALVALIAAGGLLVIAPFASAILWAAVICFSTWPLHERLDRQCGSRTLAASIMTLLIIVVTVLPFVLAAVALDKQVAGIVQYVQAINTHGLPQPPDWVQRIPLVGDYIRNYWASLAADSEKGHSFLRQVLAGSMGWFLHRTRDFGIGLTHLCISVFVAFFFYRDGEKVVGRMREVGHRVIGEYSQHLLAVIGRTVRGVVYGFLGTALSQGACGAIGYAIVGVPGSLLLGMLTFLLALVPFGPPLVWLPVTAWVFAKEGVGWGVFMGLWGILIISGIDHPIRAYLISREAKLPIALVFLGALGGVLAFGFIGLFLGPTVLAVGFALLQEFLRGKPPLAAPPPDTPDLAS